MLFAKAFYLGKEMGMIVRMDVISNYWKRGLAVFVIVNGNYMYERDEKDQFGHIKRRDLLAMLEGEEDFVFGLIRDNIIRTTWIAVLKVSIDISQPSMENTLIICHQVEIIYHIVSLAEMGEEKWMEFELGNLSVTQK
ncbi:MAG: hypothetical protein Ta2E_12460 [Mycoplasmoidaceae bacterium]|nr:MAG: hypothetical protein Ta2E_12460 [Mycoplasmoidaceae bacterium]